MMSSLNQSRPMFGLTFSTLGPDAILHAACQPIPAGEGVRLMVTANLDHIVQLRRDPAFARAYEHAWVRTIDGMPVLLYSQLRGIGVPTRITGADFVPHLLERLEPARHRMFFLVPAAETETKLRARLVERGFESDALAFYVPPFGFERDAAISATIGARIKAHGTTHLFLGVGAPKSEKWVDAHAGELGDLYVFAVGASLDFYVGAKARAPHWVRQSGLEWLHRLSQEPRRLAKRYLIDSWAFLAAVADDLRSGTAAGRPGRPSHKEES